MSNQKIIKGQIADATGHTDFAGTLDEAMTTIIDQVKNAGKWVYVNGNPFIFQNFDLAEEQGLKDMLMAEEDPMFVITPKLQGGAKKVSTVYRRRVTKQPLSKVLGAGTVAQLAVTVRNSHGKRFVDVIVSDYNQGTKRLSPHVDDIVDEIYNTFSR